MELYVRLVELRNWLRKHDDAGGGSNGDSNQGNGSARGNGLRSSGNGEPYHRALAFIHTVIICCQSSHWG
ncbi:MAG: hypothetical protein ACREBR_04015 [bacterium]